MTERWIRVRLDDLKVGQTDWKRLAETTEEEIAEQAREDGTEFSEEWWAEAVVMPPIKEAMSMRIDGDVLAWFRQSGRGYQTRMNAVLRRFMEAQKGRASTP